MTTQNLWGTAKAVLRGKINTSFSQKPRKISGKQPKATKEEQAKTKVSRRKEIIKIGAE